jgi:hypothetical protein
MVQFIFDESEEQAIHTSLSYVISPLNGSSLQHTTGPPPTVPSGWLCRVRSLEGSDATDLLPTGKSNELVGSRAIFLLSFGCGARDRMARGIPTRIFGSYHLARTRSKEGTRGQPHETRRTTLFNRGASPQANVIKFEI